MLVKNNPIKELSLKVKSSKKDPAKKQQVAKSERNKTLSSKVGISVAKTANSKAPTSKTATTKGISAKSGSGKGEVIRRIVEKVNRQRSESDTSNKTSAVISKIASANASTSNRSNVVAKSVSADGNTKIIDMEVTKRVENITFKVGDKIVYPGHGVGEIDSIRSTNIGGGLEQQFYSITILESGMKVMVPMAQAGSVGLRRIIDKKTIDQVYTILKERDFKIDTQTWNRRFREYSQKIKTGSVYEIAVVLRDLSVLSSDKELSFGEKKMLDMAQSLLASEIAIAKSRPQDKIVGELRSLFV